ncbi:Uncharacterized protein Rs2_05529 [Raphanus sativus]|nr:Uncharacterized protein Rs2_05529 [Raphanus sativus]
MLDGSSSHRLVGKFFTNSTPPSTEETEQTLRKQWVLSGDMTVQKLDDGVTFLFEFIQKNDKEKILKKRPYNVNGALIVIKDPNSSDTIDFTWDSFLVVVVGLPLYLCTSNFLPTLKSQVGDNNALFHGTSNNNRFIYLRVDIDLKKPLRPGFYIGQNQNRFVEFKYWNLGDFCYNCGRIGHVKENCVQVTFPKERVLNATSRTHVYGPWLRHSPLETSCQLHLMILPNSVGECEKSLTYPQFFVEVEFKILAVCNTITESSTKSISRFRLPCSYLYTETESTDCVTTSKASEVIRREIYDKTPPSLGYFKHMPFNIPDVTESLVEELKLFQKDKFSCDDKWLALKLQIILQYQLTHVDHETLLSVFRERSIERKISSLIKKRVEKNEDLISHSSWEDQIREVISEMGFTRYMHHSYVSGRASKAVLESIQMEISSSRCTRPADRSAVSGLERFKVLGPDMDRLEPCVICTEEMFLAEEATVMPCCSHVFHSSCIEKWFHVGHICPLCGFKLPLQK